MFQKTFTKDFMTGKRENNVGQREKHYVTNTRPAIIPEEIFDKVQEEMIKRARLIRNSVGDVEATKSKFSGKYLLENLLVYGDCGMSYRRRTERGKVLWRCATRIEKGKENCESSPTINEKWVNAVLGEEIYNNGIYQEDEVKGQVERIEVYEKHIIICCKNGSEIRIS